MANFENALKVTLEFEGLFSNDKFDTGGKTKYGITEAVARNFGYKGDMKDLPLDIAKAIYKKNYWDVNLLDQVNSQKIATEMFDTGVNMGTKISVLAIQRAINLLNRSQQNFKNIEVDGMMGPKTLGLINELTVKDEISLLKTLNIIQGYRYIEICDKNETQETFYRGWLKRVEI
jgi:lysozyme family protein